MLKIKQKWLSGFMAAAFALTTAFVPAAGVLAAEPQATVKVSAVSERLAGADRYQTAAKIAQDGWAGTSDYVVIAAGMDDNLVDALTVAPLAKLRNAPILLTEGESLNASAEAELKRLKPKTAYVSSGDGVIKKSVRDQLTSMGITVKSLGGSDRFETAVNIAKEIHSLKPFSSVIMTTAWTNADALSVASIAGAKGMPILLSDVELPSSVSTYINSIKSELDNAYVLGGSAIVSDKVKNALPNAKRIFGIDRYATNLEILKAFANDLKYGKIFVANGQDAHLVDALAASPLAAAGRAPVLLADADLSSAAQEYAKLNLLANHAVALGGETVVAPAVLTSLTAGQDYAADNASQGSADAANLAQIKDNLTISGDNVTLKNAKADYSIYVSGNNVTLENVTVSGSVFLDPGAEGTATLNNVTAANIAILSGAQNSIHLNDTKSGSLRVASENAVRIESKGSTSITNTVVSSAAILDAVAGSFGNVEVNKATEGQQVVEFRGTIGNVTVTGEVTVKAGAGATITKISIAPETKDTKVTLDGTFAAVEVNKAGEVALATGTKVTSTVVNASATLNATTGSFGKVEVAAPAQAAAPAPQVQLKGTFTEQITVKGQAKLTLADNAKVTNIKTEAKAEIIVPPTAAIEKLEDTGNTGTVVSGGGEVNGETTTTTPTTPPADTTTPPAGGGGSTVSTIAIQNVQANFNGSASASYSNGTLTLSGSDTAKLTGITVTTNASSWTIAFTTLNAPDKGGSYTINQSRNAASTTDTITTTQLLGDLDSGHDGVSLGMLKRAFGSTLTISGNLTTTASGFSTSPTSVSITLNLGGILGDGPALVSNEWVTVNRSGDDFVATIIKDNTLSGFGLELSLFGAGDGFPEVETATNTWVNVADNPTAVRTYLTSLAGASSWETAKLSDLVGKGSIKFRYSNEATRIYTLTFGN